MSKITLDYFEVGTLDRMVCCVRMPERVRMGAAMLNHTTHSTSERHYNRAGQLDASRRNARFLMQRRAELRKLDSIDD